MLRSNNEFIKRIFIIKTCLSFILKKYVLRSVKSKHPQFISDTEKYLKVKSFDN